jgi:hypothetical protein
MSPAQIALVNDSMEEVLAKLGANLEQGSTEPEVRHILGRDSVWTKRSPGSEPGESARASTLEHEEKGAIA